METPWAEARRRAESHPTRQPPVRKRIEPDSAPTSTQSPIAAAITPRIPQASDDFLALACRNGHQQPS